MWSFLGYLQWGTQYAHEIVHSHAGVGGGVLPHGALQHVGQSLRAVGLAPRAGFFLVWNPMLLEEVVLTHCGFLSVVAVLLVREVGFLQGESQGLEEPA